MLASKDDLMITSAGLQAIVGIAVIVLSLFPRSAWLYGAIVLVSSVWSVYKRTNSGPDVVEIQ